ncbi:MAG TPA: AraC family transcriptional regulator [Kofleriaceae bacterium]
MLSATSTVEFGGGVLSSTVFLERRLRVHVLRRDRLVFDSAYSPPAKLATPFVHLVAQLSGTFVPAGGAPVAAPCAFVLDESEFDRVEPGSQTVRSFGERCTVIELRVPVADVELLIGVGRGPAALAPPVWQALEALGAAPDEAAVLHLIGALGQTGALRQDLTASVVEVEPERFQRVWAVLRPLYQDLAVSASLKQISTLAGVSLRQLGRDFTELTRTFGLFGAGFRDTMRIIRLRAAVLLLSAPDATPSDVARLVGYGSLDAMGRAFRDASLAAPSIVQDAVRYRA